MTALGFFILGLVVVVSWSGVWFRPKGRKKLGRLGAGFVASAPDFELKPVLLKYDLSPYLRRRLTMGDE